MTMSVTHDTRALVVIATLVLSLCPLTPQAQQLQLANVHGVETGQERQNTKTILAIFHDIEQRDDSHTRRYFQPDFEIHWPASLPYGGTFHGLQPRPHGWSATWEPLQPTTAERKMDPHIIAAHSDDVVVLWHQRGADARGHHFDGEVLGLYHFREGKLARAQMFYFDTDAVANFLAKAKN